MTESDFNRLAAAGYNRIPVTLETFADLDTPLSIYLKLANDPYSYLLESVQGGERFGRYSIIGLAAQTRIVGGRWPSGAGADRQPRRRAARPHQPDELHQRVHVALQGARPARPAALLRRPGRRLRLRHGALHRNQTGHGQAHKPDPLGVPDILLLLSEEIAIVDNLSGKLTLVVYAEPGFPGAWKQAQARLRELLGRLRAPVSIPEDVRVPSAPAV